MIMREKNPENLEFPFPELDSFVTPNERFFVRNHFEAPELKMETWKLRVEGTVNTPIELTFGDLIAISSRKLTAMLECSGNGRVFLQPKAKGLQWEQGGVSNAEWVGVPLAAVLDRAGIGAGAVEVILEGADCGEVTEDPRSPGPIHFARSLPLSKAIQPDVILAYEMNGEPLSQSHGFPLRAIVPGWYGMCSIKWLTRIVVTDEPFNGYYQSIEYSYFREVAGIPTLTAATEMEVKSQIARPTYREIVPKSSSYRIHGAAWSGEGQVVRVEVSADAGETWADATLMGESHTYTWRLWEYEWLTPTQPGPCILMARATDDRGRVQPVARDKARRSYMISHVVPLEVEVR
ncbi:MAG: sulfite oxidase [Armatimonadota bacterium]|nr:sulfite oxidase [Armatimonadota bacterium]